MNETVTAESAEQVARMFGTDYCADVETQQEADERRTVGEYLIAAARESLLKYPMQVKHTPRDRVPDFIITVGSTSVGVETTKIANGQLEELKVMRRECGRGTMFITPFLTTPSPDLHRNDRVQAAFARQAFLYGTPEKERDQFWMQQAEEIVHRKAEILKRADFERQTENWLLLWDVLRSSERDLKRRIDMLSDLLRKFWGDGFFDKVVVEQEHFECFVVLSRKAVTGFPGRRFAT